MHLTGGQFGTNYVGGNGTMQTVEFSFYFDPLWYGDVPLDGSQSSTVTVTAGVVFANSKRDATDFQIVQSAQVLLTPSQKA